MLDDKIKITYLLEIHLLQGGFMIQTNEFHKGFLSLKNLKLEALNKLLERTQEFKRKSPKQYPKLERKVGALFYKNNSTTKLAFELAVKNLDCQLLALEAAQINSSEMRLRQNVDTLISLGASTVGLMHFQSWAGHYAQSVCKLPIINCGDGSTEDPVTALATILTILEQQNKKNLKECRVLLVGDILHSGLAKSLIYILRILEAEIILCGPRTLLPPEFAEWGCIVEYNLREGIKNVDALIPLSLNAETLIDKNFIPSRKEYATLYGINQGVLNLAKSELIIMYPGELTLGTEISKDIFENQQNNIMSDRENLVYLYMAIIFEILGGEAGEATN